MMLRYESKKEGGALNAHMGCYARGVGVGVTSGGCKPVTASGGGTAYDGTTGSAGFGLGFRTVFGFGLRFTFFSFFFAFFAFFDFFGKIFTPSGER